MIAILILINPSLACTENKQKYEFNLKNCLKKLLTLYITFLFIIKIMCIKFESI